jgi:hypothetical protein
MYNFAGRLKMGKSNSHFVFIVSFIELLLTEAENLRNPFL